MLRKFAVALLAASVFVAPVFAQGGGSTATPPAKADTKTDTKAGTAAPAATPKVVTANPDLKAAKVKSSKRYARHHVRQVRHVAHVKRVQHVKSANTARDAKHHVRHVVSKTTTGQNGAMTAPKAKSNVN